MFRNQILHISVSESQEQKATTTKSSSRTFTASTNSPATWAEAAAREAAAWAEAVPCHLTKSRQFGGITRSLPLQRINQPQSTTRNLYYRIIVEYRDMEFFLTK